jgi:hypothetical protein
MPDLERFTTAITDGEDRKTFGWFSLKLLQVECQTILVGLAPRQLAFLFQTGFPFLISTQQKNDAVFKIL